MTIQTSTLRPGYLVSLKTSVTGNVKYFKTVIEEARRDQNGAEKSRWETEREIADPAEHEAAIKTRSKVRGIVTRVCSSSKVFGLLCPEAAAPELEAAIVEARRIADKFNETANLSRVEVYIITGHIAQDDMEAVKAINSEVSEMLTAMERGIESADVKAIRDAALRAKEVAQMLSDEARVQAETAIDLARRAAREIVKAGDGAVEVDLKAIRKIREAKKVFLDLDDTQEVVAPKIRGRSVDLELVE